MFVEISQKNYQELKEYLKTDGVVYEVSDCTIEGDAEPMVHIEFNDLTSEQIDTINNNLDAIYKKNTKTKDAKTTDEKEPTIVRRRTWDEKYHTPMQEAKGFFTGENEKEEVTYEPR